MDNENKWEYDYSSQDKNESGDTGYPNVGSSGMNTANQYNNPQPEPETAYTAPQTDNGAGGATPPVHPVQPQDAQPPKQPPKKKKKFNGKRVARSAVALVLAAAMGFAGGFVGAKFGGSGKVVIQQVAPSSTADSASGSDSSITAASSSGSSLTTEQVADLVSPSVVVITTEQVVYSQWSWYGQNQVESGAGSGVIISSDGYILTCAHVVDGASVEGRDPLEDIRTINRELEAYNPELLKRPQVIAANKMDAVYAEEDTEIILDELRNEFEPKGIRVFPISAVSRQGVKELLYHINDLLKTVDDAPVVFEKEFEVQYQGDRNLPYTVTRADDGAYVVEGPRIDKMLGYTNLDSEKGFDFFQKFLKNTGVLDDLEKAGIEEGDTVRMYGLEFDYYK